MTPNDHNEHPSTGTADADPPEAEQPDPIIVPAGELLEPACGPFTDLAAQDLGEGAWRGIDTDGRPVSEKLRPDVRVGDAGKGIELRWEIALDEATLEATGTAT